ncbi:MAG: S-methyl-5-thioribose kinase [Oscillospiraceae bacterium]
MADRFSHHFLMTAQDAADYAKEKLDYFDSDSVLFASEIGDGNINYVFKVRDTSSKKSLVIKQADVLLRSSGRPLDTQRNKIEAEILKIQGELAPEFVPKVFCYDEKMCLIGMEDISAYKNLRNELMEGKAFENLGENISDFFAAVLLPTTDLVLDREKKKKRVQYFTNIELCDISEDLVFTEPYYNYKNRNIVTPENLEFVKENLYRNKKLKAQVGVLRNNFMNNAQALIHGDLHSGSIFINENGIKVIDPEFAFYGPMGYDIGNVLGNMFFPLARRYFLEYSKSDRLQLEKTIQDIFDLTFKKLEDSYGKIVTFDLYDNELFKKEYLAQVMSDSVGYAGTEIIRRVVGDSKVKELTEVKCKNIRIPMERCLVLFGEKAVENRREISSGKQLIQLFKNALKDVKNI